MAHRLSSCSRLPRELAVVVVALSLGLGLWCERPARSADRPGHASPRDGGSARCATLCTARARHLAQPSRIRAPGARSGLSRARAPAPRGRRRKRRGRERADTRRSLRGSVEPAGGGASQRLDRGHAAAHRLSATRGPPTAGRSTHEQPERAGRDAGGLRRFLDSRRLRWFGTSPDARRRVSPRAA